ncbi:F-box only protein 7 isoform X2 [Anarrhichthys ocellatus]|uniref:F-box only protein 7 isoform X2 n=1 Tax=Anarrhichthys ocellatus TaxID=433405 RepID=UPI0012EE0100|nr:F-box only protein 7 isoform X2 [Anarrhichthys ocellatus]
MKLRVRLQRVTSRVELLGADPSLKELRELIEETLLSSQGLGSDIHIEIMIFIFFLSCLCKIETCLNVLCSSADTQFSLSLNGSELLSDSGQTLSSCGIVSGDLICVVLPESAADRTTSNSQNQQNQQTAAMTSNQSSRPAASVSDPEESGPVLDPEPPSAPSWEPMLCSEAEDGQAPLSLELLHHSAQTSSPTDAIVVAGHLLMLETGFIPQSAGLKASEMPPGWRSPAGFYKLQYTHPLCENSLAMVVSVVMGPVLIINATLKVNESVDTVRKLCLKPSSYVTHEWPESAAAAFRDLNKLSRIFKDQLAYPLIAAARDAMALPVAFGLAALPPELVLRVVRLLDVRSVGRLSSVCRRFSVSMADSSLWRHLYRRDFSDRDVGRSRDTDWKELYKRFHQIRYERRHATRHRPLPPFHRNPFAPPVPLHPPLPGIIGGEYDQRPGLFPPLPRLLLPPRPRYDPIGPPPDLERLERRPTGGRAADVRRGFI